MNIRSFHAHAAALFAAAAVVAASSRASVFDDAVFKLDLRGGESTATHPGDLGSALDFSSASPLAARMGDQRGPQTFDSTYGTLPAQVEASVVNPLYPYSPETRTCLRFYQSSNAAETQSANTGVVFPGLARNGKTATFYFRLFWDGVAPGTTVAPAYILHNGCAANGWSDYGLSMMIDSAKGTGDAATGKLGVRVGGQWTSSATIPVVGNKWYDVFATVEQSDDGASTTVTLSACATPTKSGNNYAPAELVTKTAVLSAPYIYNSDNLTLGVYHNSRTYNATTRGFRGLVADMAIWDRALTSDEKFETMAGRHGAKWTIGAENGSADEFNAGDTAGIAAADPYLPEEMPWNRMRKALDAQHPTLTLKSPLAAAEAGAPKVLTVVPADSDAHQISVAVNGVLAGSFTVSASGARNITLPGRLVARDSDGNVSIAVTNLDADKALPIDQIALSGSWQIGAKTGQHGAMKDRAYLARYGFVGDSAEAHFCASTHNNSGATDIAFGVWMPSGTGDRNGWKFATALESKDGNAASAHLHLSVNGVDVAEIEGFSPGEDWEVEIPAGTLSDGMNKVVLYQEPGVSGTWTVFDYYRFELVPPPNPLVLVIR